MMNMRETAGRGYVNRDGVIVIKTGDDRVERVSALAVVLVIVLVAVITGFALANSPSGGGTGQDSPSISISSL